MSKQNCQAYLCRPYCMFFKEGEKEDLSCRGAQIVERLVDSGLLDLMNMPPLQKETRLWNTYRASLSNYICSSCPFFAEDCDFQAAEPLDDMEPCGGFMLLAHLFDIKLINIGYLDE